MSIRVQRIKILSAGVLSLILVMGVARFSYTPMLPIMQQQAGLGAADGGWLAAANYLGYLCGALIASLISDLVLKDRLYRIGLLLAVITTAGMGITENVWLWSLFRFLAGLSCAAGMLLGSGLILNWLIRHNYRGELGIHFSGAGLGMVLCAITVEVMNNYFNWSQQWWIFTAMGLLIMIPAWIWLPAPDTSTVTNNGSTMVESPPSSTYMRLFIAAYFCAGAGYVISATFIVAIVDQLPSMAGKGVWIFLIMGIAAAPSAILWDLVARYIGNLNALISAFILQTLGVLLSASESSFVFVILGAILFGGTFVGIVSLVLTMAGRLYPTRPAKIMGKMTLSFGAAQVLAPAITGVLAEQSGSYADGLYLAAIIMASGCIILLMLKKIETRENQQVNQF